MIGDYGLTGLLKRDKERVESGPAAISHDQVPFAGASCWPVDSEVFWRPVKGPTREREASLDGRFLGHFFITLSAFPSFTPTW